MTVTPEARKYKNERVWNANGAYVCRWERRGKDGVVVLRCGSCLRGIVGIGMTGQRRNCPVCRAKYMTP